MSKNLSKYEGAIDWMNVGIYFYFYIYIDYVYAKTYVSFLHKC